MGDSETVSLTEEQEAKAKKMLEQLDSESHPLDFIDEWRASPTVTELEYEELGNRYVIVDEIVGTEEHNTDRLVHSRFRSVVEMLLAGEFKKEIQFPPHLMKINGEYFVSSDGNHRVIAHKALGIDKMYAEVTHFY